MKPIEAGTLNDEPRAREIELFGVSRGCRQVFVAHPGLRAQEDVAQPDIDALLARFPDDAPGYGEPD